MNVSPGLNRRLRPVPVPKLADPSMTPIRQHLNLAQALDGSEANAMQVLMLSQDMAEALTRLETLERRWRAEHVRRAYRDRARRRRAPGGL